MIRAALLFITGVITIFATVVLAVAFHDTVARDFLKTRFKKLVK
jgi:hypothetical protein